MTPHLATGDPCHLCGGPVTCSSLVFVHRRQTKEVSCTARLCNVCAGRVEYHIRIALSDRLLQSSAAAS